MRISKKSAKKWNNLRKIGFDIFSFYKIIFAQSKTDQNNLQQITSKEIFYAINLKSCCQNLAINNSELAKIKSQIGARKILLYSSTHSLEEIEIIKIHKILQKEFPNLITIIIIRHPNRLNEVAKIIDENNLNFAIRSKNNPIIDSTDIYLVDTLGEVGIFYELVDFAFIGGSIVNVGGHNPYEAINLNCVPITGKFHYNFQDVYHEIFLKDSGFLINNSLELTALLGEILKNPNILEKYKNNLKNLQNKNTQEVKNIILKLKEII
jgi:3-deoxy-D-manno-octulosonic-acid transferase